MQKQLRPYQSDAIKAIKDNLSKGCDKALLVLATGLGKTVTAVKTADDFKRTLFIVDSEELLEQAALSFLREKFDAAFSDNVAKMGFLNYVKGDGLFAMSDFKMGAIKADVFQPNGNVVVASAQTLYKRLDRLDPEMFDLVIVDEAHCYMANTYFKGVSFFTPKLRLGLTATPHRQDNLPLGDLFDKIIYEYNIADGIKDGYLVELDAIRVKTNVSLDKVRTTAGELNQKDLSNEINTLARNNQIVDSYLKYAKGRKTITFCCDIQHCMDLADVFIERGIKATAVSSDEERTGDRSQKIRDFKAGKYDVVFNTNILTKGFDYPEVSCIIAAAPTKSLTRYMQAIGRGTRILPGVIDGLETAAERWSAIKKSDKKDCIIIDIVDNTNRHNIINAWNLDKEKEPEDRVFTTQEKKEKLLAARIAKLEHTREEDERVKLLPLPKIKMNKSIRMVEPATEAQLKAIQAWGYDIENNHYTKGMINEIFMQQSASEKQIGFLKWKGFDVSKGVSKAQAAAAFKMLEEKGLK